MKVFFSNETTAQVLLKQGVQNALSFGPALVRDGKICTNLKKSHVYRNNPRSGIGMIEKGHYIGIVVQGRGFDKSRGVNLDEFARLFINHVCKIAYNLDGGQSTAMVFMGKALNNHTKSKKGTVFRRVPEILMFGISKTAYEKK